MDTFAAGSKQDLGVEELLGRLDIEKRAVLSLYYFENFSVPEISQVLKIPEGTVKSRLFAARNEFKTLWEKNLEMKGPGHERKTDSEYGG
jgi:RNA polymerase sigma-70 factor (ECF subfamily)